MRRLLLLCCLAVPAWADEVLIPATPPATQEDPVARYAVERVVLACGGPRLTPQIVVGVVAVRADGLCARLSTGECREAVTTYRGAAAQALCETLNTANLSATSLHKRILTKLTNDGVLPAGTVSGTPGIPTPIPTPTTPPEPTATP